MKVSVILYKNHVIKTGCHNRSAMLRASRPSIVSVISIIHIFHENGNKLTIVTFLHIRETYAYFTTAKREKQNMFDRYTVITTRNI